ncbi:MAG: phytoene desaturase family protein [Thermoguttaceae bacterium]
MYDTIIIGAGMSGLAAGIRLAHFDQRVCILERHSVIGGLSSFYKRRGRNLDVGLHALTNYTPKGARSSPLGRLLRQLRMAWEELALAPQLGSAIMFPGLSLQFNNDFALFEYEVARHFPAEKDNLRRLVGKLIGYDQFGQPQTHCSAREVVSEIIHDPLLIEMLFCPVLFYGSAREHDLDFVQFSMLFRSIFLEGLARPLAGMRAILKKLLQKFKALGGELRLRASVARICAKNDSASKVVLDDGAELEAKHILSSAGWLETMRLCNAAFPQPADSNRLSLVESISILDAPPRSLGYDKTIVFFNDSERFRYEKPGELIDLHSGTICSPNNFAYCEPMSENLLRISALANYDRWAALNQEQYALAKLRWYDRLAASAVRFVPDFRSTIIDTDLFTPITIRRFTGHEGGAVYGSAQKRYDGSTHLKNLYICGNDQGLVGVIGTILSGISIANKYMLKG